MADGLTSLPCFVRTATAKGMDRAGPDGLRGYFVICASAHALVGGG